MFPSKYESSLNSFLVSDYNITNAAVEGRSAKRYSKYANYREERSVVQEKGASLRDKTPARSNSDNNLQKLAKGHDRCLYVSISGNSEQIASQTSVRTLPLRT